MRRSILCLGLVIIAMLLVASPAAAGRRWCARDPIVSLNGNPVQVWIAIPEEYVPLVNGPIEVQFRTPKGMTRSVDFTDGGFNGLGEVVTFTDDAKSRINAQGAFTIQIWVAIPIDEARADATARSRGIPTQITVIDGDKTQVLHGWNTGSWVTTRISNSNQTGGVK
jgi:hypothetical protein